MDQTKISVLIVEDDPIIAEDLVFHMKDFGYSPFPSVSNAEDAMLILNNGQPDIILLDVSIEGEMDGIDLAVEINKKFNVPIIYLTAHHDPQTLNRIKSTQPSAYLVKPLDEYSLQTSIELALYNYSHRHFENNAKENSPDDDYISGDYFFIKVKSQLKKILLEDILCLEAYDNYSFVHTKNEKLIIGSTLKLLESKLSAHDFIRAHRSYVVNLKAVEGIEEDILIIHTIRIPIGKTYKEEFMKRIKLL